MTLDDVKPDTVMVLTADLERLFELADCRPMCHACRRDIDIDMKFRLATCRGRHHEEEWRDVMLCDTCTIADLLTAEAEAHRLHLARGGGFSRPSKRPS